MGPRISFAPLFDGGLALYPARDGMFDWSKADPGARNIDIYTEDSIQKFAIGTKLVTDERVFRYCKAGAAITLPYRLHVDRTQLSATQDYANADAMVAGESVITINDTANVVNFWAGGYCEVWGTKFEFHRILSSTVSDGAEVILTLQDPVQTVVAASAGITCHRNPYAAVYPAGNSAGYETAVALPATTVTIGQWFWGQTQGKAFVTYTGTWAGDVANDRSVVMWSDGTLQLLSAVDVTADGYQIVGHIIDSGTYGSGYIQLFLE